MLTCVIGMLESLMTIENILATMVEMASIQYIYTCVGILTPRSDKESRL